MRFSLGVLLSVGAMTADAVTVSDIAQMTRAEAWDRPSCVLTGVVTCAFQWQENSFTLADVADPDGPAIYVGGDIPGYPLAELVGAQKPEPGDVVHIRGCILPLMLEPGVAAARITVTGRQTLDAPPEIRLADLMTGRYNNRRVCVTGILRCVHVQDSVTLLELGTPDGVIKVHVRGAWPELAEFRDAELAVNGVCTPNYNSRAEFLRPEVEAISREAIHVIPSRQPVRAVQKDAGRPFGVVAWSPSGYDGHLRKLNGEVTYVNPAQGFFVLQSGTAVRVNLDEDDLPQVGDLVEADGFPTVSDDCGVLDAGRFRRLGTVATRLAPQPLATGALTQILHSGDAGEYDCHYRLVKIAGRIVSVDRLPVDAAELTLAVGAHRVAVRLNAGAGELPEALFDNPPVVVSGVLKVRYDMRNKLGRGLGIEGFTLLMRDRNDLTVLSDAATIRRRVARLATRLGLWLLLPLAALALWMWVRMTRQHERARAVSADRRRMAEELHDTIAQYLSGARLLLFSVQGEAEAALSPAARGAVSMAGDILETARRELRDKILNLQSDELLTRPLAQLLKEIATRTNVVSGARVRTRLRGLPADISAQMKNDLLATVQEAISNAIKHGHARRIVIVSDPIVPFGFALSILNDGAKFDAAAALGPETGHFGLSSMRERATRNGFTLTFGERKGWTEVRLERKRQ
ncbi:MAG: sensor histidine kinase [Kiritimatiellia bacterium]